MGTSFGRVRRDLPTVASRGRAKIDCEPTIRSSRIDVLRTFRRQDPHARPIGRRWLAQAAGSDRHYGNGVSCHVKELGAVALFPARWRRVAVNNRTHVAREKPMLGQIDLQYGGLEHF